MPNPIQALAEYLTGPDVGHHSIALGVPDGPLGMRARAERFFKLREAFGVEGCATAQDAERSIIKTLNDLGK
jgi:hypothetical protein